MSLDSQCLPITSLKTAFMLTHHLSLCLCLYSVAVTTIQRIKWYLHYFLLVCPTSQCPKRPTYPCSCTPGTQERPPVQKTHSCGSVAPPWQPCSHAGPRCALSQGAVWTLARSALPTTGTNAQKINRAQPALDRPYLLLLFLYFTGVRGTWGKGHFVSSNMGILFPP